MAATTRIRPWGQRRTFGYLALTLFALMAAAGAPSSMYAFWSRQFAFSATTLTLVFASYVLTVLVTLVLVGSYSDHVGRHSLLVVAIVIQLVGLGLFVPADSPGWLLLARGVQGVATALALAAVGAAILDTEPPGSNLGTVVNSVIPQVGFAVGAFGAGLVTQYAPRPTAVVFLSLVVVFALLLICTPFVPETLPVPAATPFVLRPRIRVPGGAGRAFLAAVPCLVATSAVSGLYLSLGGSLLGQVFGTGGFYGGLLVAAISGPAAVATVLFRTSSAGLTSWVGGSTLVGGLGLGLAALAGLFGSHGLAVFLLGSVSAGFGFGAAYLGAFRTVVDATPADHRAATLTAVLVVTYLAYSLPVLVAGVVSTRIGLLPTSVGYLVAVMALTGLSTALDHHRRRRGPASYGEPALARRVGPSGSERPVGGTETAHSTPDPAGDAR